MLQKHPLGPSNAAVFMAPDNGCALVPVRRRRRGRPQNQSSLLCSRTSLISGTGDPGLQQREPRPLQDTLTASYARKQQLVDRVPEQT